MKGKNLFCFLVLASILVLSGCVARTYPLTRDRVDQDVEAGNRGFLMGRAPIDTTTVKKETRTVRVFEIEIGSSYKAEKASVSAETKKQNAVISAKPADKEVAFETTPLELTTTSATEKKYTVGKNDTLQKISEKFYGTTKKWIKIYVANKDTLKGPDKVYPGQVLNIPDVSGQLEAPEKLKETEANLK